MSDKGAVRAWFIMLTWFFGTSISIGVARFLMSKAIGYPLGDLGLIGLAHDVTEMMFGAFLTWVVRTKT